MLHLKDDGSVPMHSIRMDECDVELMLRGLWEAWGAGKAEAPSAYRLVLLSRIALALEQFRLPF